MYVDSNEMKLHQLCIILWTWAIFTWQPAISEVPNKKYSEIEAAKYLDNANHALAQWTNRVMHSDWNWNTNLTDENAEKKVL